MAYLYLLLFGVIERFEYHLLTGIHRHYNQLDVSIDKGEEEDRSGLLDYTRKRTEVQETASTTDGTLLEVNSKVSVEELKCFKRTKQGCRFCRALLSVFKVIFLCKLRWERRRDILLTLDVHVCNCIAG